MAKYLEIGRVAFENPYPISMLAIQQHQSGWRVADRCVKHELHLLCLRLQSESTTHYITF